MRTIQCEICGTIITTNYYNQRFCKSCSKLRRREKYKEYDKKRPKEQKERLHKKAIITKREVRQQRKDQGLCVECGKPKERPEIQKCNKCNEAANIRCTKHNRKIGFAEAGQSKPQQTAYNILCELIECSVDYNNRNTIYNPETGYPLELDMYVPDLAIAVEIDGPMHFEPVYGISRWEMQMKNDLWTNIGCDKKDIKLIRITTYDIDQFGEDWLRATLSQAILG